MLTEPDTATPTVTPSLDASVIPGLVWAFRLHHDGSAEPLPVDDELAIGQDRTFTIPLDKLLLFDRQTEERAKA